MYDFMAPITGVPLREHGRDRHVPCRMLQKRIADRKSSLGEIHHEGDVFLRHHRVLAEGPIDRQSVLLSDLLRVSLSWYRRSPRPLKNIAMADNQRPTRKLVLRAASIDGGCYSVLESWWDRRVDPRYHARRVAAAHCCAAAP